MKIKGNDYPYIRAWGVMLSSYNYYIMGEVERARRDNAPQDAIYYSDVDDRWHTVDEVESDDVRKVLDRSVTQ